MFRCLIVIAATLGYALTALAQILPGRDAYLIRLEAQTLPNGVVLPQTTHIMKRPAAGTYVNGVVIVKTRAIHGIHKNDKLIEGSDANMTLQSIGAQTVTSTFERSVADNTIQMQTATAIGLDRFYTVHYSQEIDAFDVCLRLMEAPDVEYAVPVEIHSMSFTPNDPDFATKQPWLTTMKLQEAWDVSKGSASVIIAIVDSGVDWEHEDLSAQIFTNVNEIPNNNIDDDKNGYIDDVRGWDFVGNITTTEAQNGIRKPDNDPKVRFSTINGTNGHGTVSAGCASAHTNNAKGIASPGFNCKILPVKVASDNPQVGGILAGYEGIVYSADMGAQIINCSWGGTSNNPMGQEIINYALGKGALVVAASGNNGLYTDVTPHYPSGYRNVLSVGASTLADQPANWSNYGSDVTTYAPGENIYSTFPNLNRYQAFTGTSFSAPLVAGICGLIKAAHPDWTPEMVLQQIRSTSDALNGVSEANRITYFGRVNAARALKFNQSFSSGDRIPGIAVERVTVTGNNAINSYAPTEVIFTLKNYLASASNVKITITPRSSGATISGNTSVTIPNIEHNTTTPLPLTVQLQPTYPWYEAELSFLITIQSGLYVNYVIVGAPVNLPTSNRHTAVPSSPLLPYELLDYTSDGMLWVGSNFFGQPAIVVGSVAGQSGVASLPYKPTVIKGLGGYNALIGGLQTGKATISRTTNGQSWTPTDVSGSMGTVGGIVMFDAQNGMAVGNPVGGKIGAARTTDGGVTWQKMNNTPNSITNEKVLDGVLANSANGLWFCTSARRIIYTTNRGTTWATSVLGVNGAVLKSIAFSDDKNGVLVYEAGGASLVASCKDAITWTPAVFDPSTLGIRAVATTSPGKHHLLIGENGEVYGSDDVGASWQAVLSKPTTTTTMAIARSTSPTTVATLGDGIGILEYRYSGPNGTRLLSASVDTLNFGSLEENQNRLRSARLNSTGESDVLVESVEITVQGSTPADAFRLTGNVGPIIPSGGYANVPVRMYATQPGTYRGTLTIRSNAQDGPITIELVGIVGTPSSVQEEATTHSLNIYPNPATTEFTLYLPSPSVVWITNMSGVTVGTEHSLPAGEHIVPLHSLTAGSYFVMARSASKTFVSPLIILR